MSIRTSAPALLLVLISACAGPAAQVQPDPAVVKDTRPPAERRAFSADVEDLKADGTPGPVGRKIFVSGDRIRAEIELDGKKAVQIYLGAGKGSLMLRPEERQWARMPDMPLITAGAKMLNADDPQHPCAGRTHLTCERLDATELEGRPVTRWAAKNAKTQELSHYLFVDEELAYVLRLEAVSGATKTLRHLKVGPQPESLFEAPPDYTEWRDGDHRSRR